MSETTEKKSAAPRKPRTKKVAESAPVENVEITEVEADTVNDEGQTVITGPKKPRSSGKPTSNNFTTETGAIGSRAATRSKPIVEEKNAKVAEKVAVWSDKNIRWSDVGMLVKGYNLVTKEAAEKWLTKAGIREATAEEVSTYYSK